MQAYISSFNDAASVTITLPAGDLDRFVSSVRSAGLRTADVPVHGRFHHATHAEAVDKLAKLALQSEELSLPEVAKLVAPIRSTVDGGLVAEASLTRVALEAILLKPAQWYKTMREAVGQVSKPHPAVAAFVGYGNHIPASLSQESSLQVHLVRSLQAMNNWSPPSRAMNGVSGMDGATQTADEDSWVSKQPAHSIAIVGMAGRFPGADSVDELWDLLVEGRVTVERAPERVRLPQTGDYADTKWWGNFVRDVDAFDHRFFNKSSREALACDPQLRLLLEVVYAALESAGHFGPAAGPPTTDVGCYIGAVNGNYADNVACHTPSAYNTTGTSRSFISGQVSHHFGWTGPALTIDTACSASLVAINSACRAIWTGECAQAVAGGTNLITSPFDYLNLAAAGFLSPTGQCKSFDAAGDGYCRAEGVAAVVLKPLADAVRDRDDILGVILGSAVNQNHSGSHIAVPQTASQTALYRKTMTLAGVRPEAVSYVEAHGTGTGVGDPVEVASIRTAFGGPQRHSTLHFGSIKGNLGHSEATAGVAGLVKVLLQMKNGKIPMQASHNSLNPKIPPLEMDRMGIPRSLLPWDSPNRLACVTSYGAAGSNSAVLLGDGPPRKTTGRPLPLPNYPLFISAASENSLSAYCAKLLELVRDAKGGGDADIISSLAFQLADRANHALPHVLATRVESVQDLKAHLEAASRGSGIVVAPKPKPVVLVFGGQESDFVGISEDVYRSSKVFRRHLDSCNETLVAKGFESFYPSIFQTETMKDIVTLHSALFAVQYASAATWIDCGLKVDAVVGHSFGQLTAFCVSGALSLPDAMELVTGRASLMKKHWGPEPGSMLFVEADRQTIERTLESLRSDETDAYAEVACYNGPQSHVVVGSSKSITTLEEHFRTSPALQSPVRTKRLAVTQGFHSRYTEPMLPHLADLARTLEWKRPYIHLETCEELESTSEPDFKIVAEHTRRPVFFQKAIERLSQRFPECTWIEAGRGSSVIQLVRGSAPGKNTFISPQLASPKAQGSLIQATLDLWKSGCTTQYWMFHRHQRDDYGPINLPPYQFEKTRHWLPFTGHMGEPAAETEPAQTAEETHELLSFLRFADGSENEAIFRIDPQADRFQTLLRGHVMTGRAMTPASLSFEVAARAALFLQKDLGAATYVPTVDELIMKAPVGQDIDKEIRLTLKRMGDAGPSWSFSITTRTAGAQTSPFEHTVGQVYLKRRDDARSAREFARFESLVGLRRCHEIINDAEAETMQGKHIYRAFSTVVSTIFWPILPLPAQESPGVLSQVLVSPFSTGEDPANIFLRRLLIVNDGRSITEKSFGASKSCHVWTTKRQAP